MIRVVIMNETLYGDVCKKKKFIETLHAPVMDTISTLYTSGSILYLQ